MKKLLLTIIFFLLPLSAFSAELLVKANKHWMDDFTQFEVDEMTSDQKQSYEARSQIGDIIVVRPDGWNWGKEEGLPKYVVVKVPQITEAEAKKYEESLTDNTNPEIPILKRVRKYALPKVDIVKIKTNSISLTKTVLTSKLITKTGLTTEISAPINSPIAYLWHNVEQPLMVAYHYWIENSYAATQLLKTVKPSGGDYTSLEACMHANEQNLVTADKYFDVEIDGSWSSADTTAVVIHNYTTDATRYINIYTTTAARHKGVWSTSYYILEPASGNAISSTALYITINGLQARASGSVTIINNTGGASLNISNCIVRGNSSNANGYVIQNFGKIWNCIVYDISTTSGQYGVYNGTAVYSTTVISGWIVMRSVVTVKNCYAGGGSFGTDYWGITNMTTSASSDATSGSVGLRSIAVSTTADATHAGFTNITGGSEDFHIKVGSPLIDVGTDTSGDAAPLNFTDDIDGVTRTGTWDIGADEYVAAGGAVDDSQVFIIN